jgi:hypothetical protein
LQRRPVTSGADPGAGLLAHLAPLPLEAEAGSILVALRRRRV